MCICNYKIYKLGKSLKIVSLQKELKNILLLTLKPNQHISESDFTLSVLLNKTGF